MRFLPFSVLFTLAVSLTVVARAGDVPATGIAWIDHPDERLVENHFPATDEVRSEFSELTNSWRRDVESGKSDTEAESGFVTGCLVFLSKGPESEFEMVRRGERPVALGIAGNYVWERVHSAAEVACGIARNRAARRLFLENLANPAGSPSAGELLARIRAAELFWLGDDGVSRPSDRFDRLRKESGIEDADLFRTWLAHRKAALSDLNRLKTKDDRTFSGSVRERPLGFSFSFDEQVPFGNDLRWSVSVTNETETTETVAVAFSVDWLQYNGEVLASVSKFATTNAIAPFSSTNVECRVPVSTYRSFLSASETFECSAAAWNVFDEDNEDVELMRAFVEADNLPSIGIAPVPLPAPGDTATVTVAWTNSTPFALSAVFSLALSDGLKTADGEWYCEWPTNAIPPGGACVLQTNVVVSGSGLVSPTVHMMSDSYPRVENTLELAE